MMWYDIIRYETISYNATILHTMIHYGIKWSVKKLYDTIQHKKKRLNTIWCGTIAQKLDSLQNDMILNDTER